ncbi:MAG: hypothetical protein M1828_003168 [Chrysothrix sp. TS-e1954]|nr:MAG: hypothetical protein M1828_003168 [Chrysothrix sp. TS-e1954]
MLTLLAWACLILQVFANVEKTIFVGPPTIHIPDTQPTLGSLNLLALSPDRTSLRVAIERIFPVKSAPQGLSSWFLLSGLEHGRRYEVRTCWAATQPTQFWLDTFTLGDVFDTPALISDLAIYAESRQGLSSSPAITPEDPDGETPALPSGAASLLFLRIFAAADYFTMNETLMQYPPPIETDIVLDPFILNVLPRSLYKTAIYLSVLAIISWLVAALVWRFLASIRDVNGNSSTNKVHEQ